MTELGTQVARLLAPDRWREWDWDGWSITHRDTELRIYLGSLRHDPFCGPAWFSVGPTEPRALGGWWDRRRLLHMACRIVNQLEVAQSQKLAKELSRKLMTAEERAVEDFINEERSSAS